MSESTSGVGGWKLIALIVGATLGWGLLITVMFSPPEWLNNDPPAREHAPYEPATLEGPPVITLRALRARGFDETQLEAIEPHFHVLNAALVTIVELMRAYNANSDAAVRLNLRQQAVYFHNTADMHEEQIERLLPLELQQQFHTYIREGEAKAGLHTDTIWHRHDDPAHKGRSSGFETR